MITFEVKLRSTSLLCVGWSHPLALGPDVPFARRRTEKGYEAFIPGSSFKGALRSSASRIAKAYSFSSCGEVRPELIHKGDSNVCDVCELFGIPGSRVPSTLIVSDLNPLNEVEFIPLTRIRLEDISLKAAEGALFTTEYCPCAEFKGMLTLRRGANRLLGLLLVSLAELRLGRFGKSSIIDLKIEKDRELREVLDPRWHPLLDELEEWLWS